MELDPTEVVLVINRIKRGRSARLRTPPHRKGRECEQLVTQLAAVSKALDRAGFTIVATGLQQCLRAVAGTDDVDVKKMAKLFLSLA